MPTTTKTIPVFFTNVGVGATGLTVTVDIIRISDGTKVVTAGAASEISDGAYKFDFVAFDNAEDYLTIFDAGVAAVVDSRFARGIIAEVREQISDQVWDEAESDHVAAGSTGLVMKIVRTFLMNKRILREISATSFEYEVFEDGGSVIFLKGTITASGAESLRSEAS